MICAKHETNESFLTSIACPHFSFAVVEMQSQKYKKYKIERTNLMPQF